MVGVIEELSHKEKIILGVKNYSVGLKNKKVSR